MVILVFKWVGLHIAEYLLGMAIIAGVAILGLSIATGESPQELVVSVQNTIEVVNEVSNTITLDGGLESRLERFDVWLDLQGVPR